MRGEGSGATQSGIVRREPSAVPPSSGPLPRISVVVPSYNQGCFLPDALESIFRQNYPDVEVVVMDGGSTDGSAAVIESYAPRLRYWQSRPDGGQSAAINAGLRHCTGDLVAWLNSDDFFWRDALWTVGRAYAAYPGRGLYIGNGFRYEQATARYTPFCSRHVALDRESLLWGTDFLLQPSTFMLREAWEEVGGLDPQLNFCMDWDVFLRIAARRPAVLINEFLGVSREYDETKTRSGKLERMFENIRMIRRHAQEALTPGNLIYLLNTLLELTEPWGLQPLRANLIGALMEVGQDCCMRWGGGHGWPLNSGPEDVIYLPFAGDSAPEPTLPPAPALPPVSVIVPSAGDGPLLARTLESVRGQDYPDVEPVVVDRSDAARGCGLAKALNRGLARARGEILAWLRPGDLATVGALRAVGQLFAEEPDVDVIIGNAVHIDGAERFYAASFSPWPNGFWIGEAPDPIGALPPPAAPYPVAPATVYFRRRAVDRLGDFDEGAPDGFCDYEFVARLTSGCRVRKLERTQALYRGREVDLAGWWAGCYRAARRRWPGLLSREFPTVLRRYVAAYMRRKYPGARRGLSFWATAAVVALSAATRVGNPEWSRPPAPVPPPAPAGPEPADAAPGLAA
jgi:glycosyltransferase involved in cell wall biosynthesis